MRIKPWLLGLALPLMLGGCYVQGRTAVAYASYDPPPPQYTYVDVRPGYLWVDGYWYWGSNAWAWRDGYYTRERPGYLYVQGNYVNRRWHNGYWQPHRTVVVNRSGRTYVQPRSGGGRVVIRDHRR